MTHLCWVLLNSCEFSYAFLAALGLTHWQRLSEAGYPNRR